MNRRFVRLKKKKTITSVLVSNYIIIMCISLIIGLILFTIITNRNVRYKQKINDTHVMNTFKNFIEVQLSENEYIVSNILTDNNLRGIMLQKDNIKAARLSTFLNQKIAERSSIQSIHIIDNAGKIYSEYKYPVNDVDNKEFIQQFDFDAVNNEINSSYWFIGCNQFETNKEDTLYMIRTIRSKYNFSQMGYLIIFFDPLIWKDNLDTYASQMNFVMQISTDANNIYIPSIDTNDSECKLLKEESSDSVVKMRIDKLNATLYGQYMGKQSNSNVAFAMILFVLVNLFFILISSVVIRNKVTQPLVNIAEIARNIKHIDDLNVRFQQKDCYVEIKDIESALNEMMEQITTLVEEVNEKNKIENQLKLSVLNHQVKPHFLYNTLNTISILIAVEQKETANELIKTLARYYRACLSKGQDMITLESEIEIVKQYIAIALIRNPNIVQVTYAMEEECMEAMIPKMTIQTLIENCIKYGIKEAGKPVEITIRVWKLDNSRYQVQVHDNGSGMSQEIQKMIMEGKNPSVDSGFGLKSVVTRIRLAFDLDEDVEIMKIQSEVGQFAEINLLIPYKIG